MSQKKPFRIGELVYCENPEVACKLPLGLPRNAVMEVVGSHTDTTHVLHHGKLFTVLTACVSQIKDYGKRESTGSISLWGQTIESL